MWSKPWSYKEGLTIGTGLLIIGILLQMTVGAINWDLFACPVNVIVLVVYIIALIVMHLLRKRVYLFSWLSHYSAAVTVILAVGVLVVGITEGIIIHASFGNPEEPVDYVVVLGAKVNRDGPSVSLWDRICAAYTYLDEHPNVTAVLSGGQGTDEPITEAECMYRELVNLGIDPQRLWMEEDATSTWENLNFSLDLIEEKTGARPQKLGVLSSEYHLYRASRFAKACGVEFVGIPAKTSRLSQKINHFMREVAGVWHYILLGGNYD